MGQVCSGDNVKHQVEVTRDADDRELDEVEMRITKIDDFDSFFESAAAPLNDLVDRHNGILDAQENLKSAAIALHGDAQFKFVVRSSGAVEMVMWTFDDRDNEREFSPSEVDATVGARPEMRDAYDRCHDVVKTLNDALENGNGDRSSYIVKLGRLRVTRKGSQDRLVRDVNIASFALRKELMLAAQVHGLKAGIQMFLKELAKTNDVKALRVRTTDNGAIRIMEGDRELNLRGLKMAKPAAQLRDALCDLLDNVETAANDVPGLAEKCKDFSREAAEFPAKVPDAVSSSGLMFTEIPKATKSTAQNVKALGQAPKIVKATTELMQHTATELQDAVRSPLGA